MNGILAAMAGGAFIAANKFGKGLLQGYLHGMAGSQGAKIFDSVLSHNRYAMNFIPGLGPANFIRKAATGSLFKQWKGLEKNFGVPSFKSAFGFGKTFNNALKEVPTQAFWDELTTSVGSSEHGLKALSSVRDKTFAFAKSLKNNPRSSVGDLHKSWNNVFSGWHALGIDTSAHTLHGTMKTSLERVNDIALQAQRSRGLIGAALASNAAVIGIPTLSSSVATYAIGRSLAGKMSRRVRGYDRNQ